MTAFKSYSEFFVFVLLLIGVFQLFPVMVYVFSHTEYDIFLVLVSVSIALLSRYIIREYR